MMLVVKVYQGKKGERKYVRIDCRYLWNSSSRAALRNTNSALSQYMLLSHYRKSPKDWIE